MFTRMENYGDRFGAETHLSIVGANEGYQQFKVGRMDRFKTLLTSWHDLYKSGKKLFGLKML